MQKKKHGLTLKWKQIINNRFYLLIFYLRLLFTFPLTSTCFKIVYAASKIIYKSRMWFNVKERFQRSDSAMEKKNENLSIRCKSVILKFAFVHSRDIKFSLDSKWESKNDGGFSGAVKKNRANNECAG